MMVDMKELLKLSERLFAANTRLTNLLNSQIAYDPQQRLEQDIAVIRARREYDAAKLAYENGVEAAANEPESPQ
jgi:hypothetical protein